MSGAGDRAQEQEARRRADYLRGVLWHLGSYAIICVALAGLDFWTDGRLGWSLWIAALWAIGLAFHVLAHLIDGSGFAENRARRFDWSTNSGPDD